jgi:hypothetical protein
MLKRILYTEWKTKPECAVEESKKRRRLVSRRVRRVPDVVRWESDSESEILQFCKQDLEGGMIER